MPGPSLQRVATVWPERIQLPIRNRILFTKKRTQLTCDNLETIVYLHEVWPKVREWASLAGRAMARQWEENGGV
jgi:hypothetical protein